MAVEDPDCLGERRSVCIQDAALAKEGVACANCTVFRGSFRLALLSYRINWYSMLSAIYSRFGGSGTVSNSVLRLMKTWTWSKGQKFVL